MTKHDEKYRHKVVIVGGGFGGLPAMRRLGGKPVEVTVIDRRNYHLFQPLLYQVATGMLPPGQIAAPIRHIVRKHKNIRVEMAEVTGFELERRLVHATAPGNMQIFEVPYDSLIVAAGVNQSYFGHDEFAWFAPGMKTIDDALELRRRVFGAFEAAELTDDPTEREKWLTFVIVGGGPTGVELAGQLRDLAHRCLKGEYRKFEANSARVILVDGGKEPLATFGNHLSGKASKELEHIGVELRMDSRVVGIDLSGADLLTADGSKSRIEAYTTIWAAGVEASPLAAELAKQCGAEIDRAGRIAVLPDLSLPGHPEVFAIGDMMSLNHLPGVAEVAMQGGLHAANTILRRLKDEDSNPFQYRDLGSAASVARFRAVVSVHGIKLAGFPGWVVWCFVHLGFLTGFGSRISTVLKWTRSMVGRGRAEREFSTAHTGGDLSLPETVRELVQPNPYPVLKEYTNRHEESGASVAAPAGARAQAGPDQRGAASAGSGP